jgi:tripartite-type tricarboxylate transporter receptor subunit TctC
MSSATMRSQAVTAAPQVKLMLEREDIRKNIAAMGARPDYGTPHQFSDFVAAETTKFASIIDKEGLHLDVQ